MAGRPSLIKPILIVASLWSIATFVLYLASRNIEQRLSLPRDIKEIRSVVQTLHKTTRSYYYSVLLFYILAYLYKQTFAIPGSVFLNIIGGALFGSVVAVPLVCVLTATGASLSYSISYLIGSDIVNYYLHNKIEALLSSSSHGNDQFMVLLSVRLFPASPNWLLNVASPHLGVKLWKFYLSVLVGLIPYNFLCVQTGVVLSEITNINGFMDTKTFFTLTSISVMLIGFAYFRQKRHRVHAD